MPAPSDIGFLLLVPLIVAAFVVAVDCRLPRAEEVAVYLDAVVHLPRADTRSSSRSTASQSAPAPSSGAAVAIAYPIVHLAPAGAGLVALLAVACRAAGGGYLLLARFAILGFAWVEWLRQAPRGPACRREPAQLRVLGRDHRWSVSERATGARRRPPDDRFHAVAAAVLAVLPLVALLVPAR